MNLSVATNFDPRLLDLIKDYQVKEIYGSLSKGDLGSALPAIFLPLVTKDTIEKRVIEAHKRDIEFNYILNTQCSKNMEYQRRGFKKIISLLEWISSIKIDTITVSLPFLIDIVQNNFPELKTKVSVLNRVNTLQKAKFYEYMGVDAITIDVDQNRNFKLLKLLSDNLDVELSLLLNNLCLWNCPYASYHATTASHTSQSGRYDNYCEFNCRLIKSKDLSQMIKSRWIRPEDIPLYEEIGVHDFKIGGRTQSINFLVRAVRAYSTNHYDGNLYKILNTSQKANYKDKSRSKIKEYIYQFGKKNILNLPIHLLKVIFLFLSYLSNQKLNKIARMLAFMSPELVRTNLKIFLDQSIPYIDNRKLDGFLDYFKKRNCSLMNCEECKYCEQYAKYAINYSEKERKKIALYLNRNLEILNNRG